MNATMPELKAAFEEAGFSDVKTVLASGNVLFTANRSAEASLERKAEAAMSKRMGHRFLRAEPEATPALPIELHGARILRLEGREAFSTYLPTPKGPVFMSLIEKTFGKDVTTRTWETVAKLAR